MASTQGTDGDEVSSGHLGDVARDSGGARGGIVKRPTRLWVGEAGPEVLIPLSKLEKVLGGGRGMTINGDVYGFDDFSERVQEADLQGKRQGLQEANLMAIPLIPANFRVTGQTGIHLNVAWTGVSGANSYIIRHRPLGLTSWLFNYGVTGTSHTVFGLSIGVTYELNIRAENAEGSSNYSANILGTTLITTPGAPTGLSLTSNAPASVTASWNPVTTPYQATSYTLEYRPSGNAACQFISGITATSRTVTALSQDILYEFRVKSINASGGSGYSAIASIYTNGSSALKPQNFGIISETTSSIRMFWDAVPGATGYRIWRKPATSPAFGSGSVVTDTSATKSGLPQNALWDFQVAAINNGAETAPADVLSGYTLGSRPFPPSGISAIAFSGINILVRWEAVGGWNPATSYTIEYKTASQGWAAATAISGLTDVTHLISGLIPGETYDLRIRAVNSGGSSANSPIIRVQTLTYQAPLDYRLRIDWDGDSQFGNALANVWDYVFVTPSKQAITCKRGRTYKNQVYGRTIAGSMEFSLVNSDGLFNNLSTSSALQGKIVPHRQVRWEAKQASSSEWNPLWVGFIDKILQKNVRSGNDTVSVSCFGILQRLTQFSVPTESRENISVEDATEFFLEEAGIPPEFVGSIDAPGSWSAGGPPRSPASRPCAISPRQKGVPSTRIATGKSFLKAQRPVLALQGA